MNIRAHVLKSIRSGMPARFDVQVERGWLVRTRDEKRGRPSNGGGND